ncbi:MAG: hypothetical protein IKC77_03285, partial [Lentisphaeria bacterium]|nr:hypothetical protein [Lentisphaeria bacterium]
FNINPFLSRGKPLFIFRHKKRETSCVSHNILKGREGRGERGKTSFPVEKKFSRSPRIISPYLEQILKIISVFVSFLAKKQIF